MNIRVHNNAQNLIFSLLIIATTIQADGQTCDQHALRQLQWSCKQKLTEHAILSDDDKILQELWSVTGALYNKMIETTALYFTGMLIDSDHFHKQMIFELGKHLLYASKAVAQYVPKLLNNPKISWRLKLKRSLYVASFLVIMVVWMQECYKPSQQLHPGTVYRDGHRSQLSAIEVSPLDISMTVSPRQRPQ